MKTLNHEKPDRIPLDLGAGFTCGISIVAYKNFLDYLGITVPEIKVESLTAQLAEVNETMFKKLGVDFRPVKVQSLLGGKALMIKKVKGTIFNIQRYSIHDGPGIRTVVFIKGCNLDCPWCSNPESQNEYCEIFWEPSKCIGCGSCANVCPNGAIKKFGKEIKFARVKCENCGQCVQTCYAEARTIQGRKISPKDVYVETLKDRKFYKKSGGGVTLSGGEPLLKPNFSAEILKKLRDANIHTAIETAGYVPWENFSCVVPYTNLFLYDIKHFNSKKHKRYIGVENSKILANLENLVEKDCRVIIRTPVIPDFNDNRKAIKKISDYAINLGISEIHLLEYHNYGMSKYNKLGRKYPYKNHELKEDKIEELKKIPLKAGLKVKVGG